MRIGLDAHYLGARMTGNETYIACLMQALARLDHHNEYHVLTACPAAVPDAVRAAANFRVARLACNWAPVRIGVLLPTLTRRAGADLLHVTYVAPPISWTGIPFVVTVHDVSFKPFPEFLSPRDRWGLSLLVPLSVRRAARVITISENTKRDLQRFYGLPEDRIDVTYLAASDDLHPLNDPREVERVRARYGLTGPYILALGNLEPRKNLERLVQAYALLREQRQLQQRLVLAGQISRRSGRLLSLIDKLGLRQHVVFTGYVEPQDLPALYSGAELFVFPSLYEGFGLPVVEAMACGCAVVCSNSSSLPEVAGDAALLVNPYSVEDLASAMLALTEDVALRAVMAARGTVQARRFSWERTATQTLATYRRALQGTRPHRDN